MTHIIIVFLLAGIFWVLLNIDHNLVMLGRDIERMKGITARIEKNTGEEETNEE